MSGGSYDYAQYKLDEIADQLRGRHPSEAHVLALADLFTRLGEVMHLIEWADSCDTSWDADVDAAIRSVIEPASELSIATRAAVRAHSQLTDLLNRVSEAGSGASSR